MAEKSKTLKELEVAKPCQEEDLPEQCLKQIRLLFPFQNTLFKKKDLKQGVRMLLELQQDHAGEHVVPLDRKRSRKFLKRFHHQEIKMTH
jgi:hypothetical protein